jgi:hypothetical protein
MSVKKEKEKGKGRRCARYFGDDGTCSIPRRNIIR